MSLNQDELELAPGFEHENLQGQAFALATEDELRDALEKAFDYRGDVTITRKSGATIEGYVFDRRIAPTLAASEIRLIPKGERKKETISFADIAALAFTGRDTAAGKSWEAWVKKYNEKKAAGETNIEPTPEVLD
ncbi:MAG: hypothetical protein FJW38_13355 [Acidobacteria bacterium]|nr:hypothetical protein [Acidobacteriota bacterium]